MIVFDTNKEIPYFFIHVPQTITYPNFSQFERLGNFHHGDGGETIPFKNTCKNKVSPPPPGDGGETLLAPSINRSPKVVFMQTHLSEWNIFNSIIFIYLVSKGFAKI